MMATSEAKLSDSQNVEDYQLTGLKNVSHINTIQSIKGSQLDNNEITIEQNEQTLDQYQIEIGESEANEEENEAFLLRLISAVKLYPIIYDPNFQPTTPRHALKKHKNDAWMRIRMELVWNGSPLETIWGNLLDQYTRRITMKPDDTDAALPSRVMHALQWIDQFIAQRIKNNPASVQRSTSVSNSSLQQQTGIEKDAFYAEMPQNINEDVMISGCRPMVSHSGQDYVVVQPQRTRHSSHQPQGSVVQSTSSQQINQQPMVRNYSMPQHITTSTNQLSASQPVQSQQQQQQQASRRLMVPSQNMQQYPAKRTIPDGQILQVIKKDDNNSGTMTMMVDMTTFYQNGSGQKMYRLLSVPPGTQPPNSISQSQQVQQQQAPSQQASMPAQQHAQTVRNVPMSSRVAAPTSMERKFDVRRNSREEDNFDLPPEPLIETSPNGQMDAPPPKKKATYVPIRHNSMSQPASSNNNLMLPVNRIENNTIVAGGIPISEDEIIDDGIQESTIVIDSDGHLHEESPLLSSSPDVMISGQSARGHQPPIHQTPPGPGGMEGMRVTNSHMASTSAPSMHHHHQQHQHHHPQHPHQSQQHHHQHHQIPHHSQHHQNIVRPGRAPLEEAEPEEVEPTHEELNQTQYDADLQFQQLISSHLSRLNDDDKAIMKYNMQRILLDARFGDGTAKQLLGEEDIIDPVHEELESSSIPTDGSRIQ